MRYLLDVNALIALGLEFHIHHSRIAHWFRTTPSSSFLTCSITELGFVRIIAQIPEYRTNIKDARELLLRLKQNTRFQIEFIADSIDIAELPVGFKAPLRQRMAT